MGKNNSNVVQLGMVDIPVLIIGLVVIVLIWYVGDFLGKLGNPEGRKELSGELKKEKFWNTQTFVIVVVILIVLKKYLY